MKTLKQQQLFILRVNFQTTDIRRQNQTTQSIKNKQIPVDGRGFFATIKYNSSGEQKWVVRYRDKNIQKSQSIPTALVLDPADPLGNFYVSGTTTYKNGHSKFTTIKYVQSRTK